MINSADLSGKLATDVKGMSELRQAARQNSPEALKATAKQFEALFMNMVLKSMRDATPQDGLFDSEQSKMYTSMLDQQISQNMASRGVGLADVLVRQLSNTVKPNATDPDAGGLQAAPSGKDKGASKANAAAGAPAAASRSSNVREFRDRVSAHAEQASRETGIPAKFMIGQAALETGWGRREIVGADGTNSHNLFGIKATSSWKGKVVEATTTEYVNGVAQTRIEKFRAYDSYADSFRDYARMLRSNPRYQDVLANARDVAGFARGLQSAGYATDPRYAEKLTRIINQTLSA